MEKLLFKVYKSRSLTGLFKIISKTAVAISLLAYAALLFHSFYSSVYEGLSVLLSAALPFFLIGAVRLMIDAPRPYELYSFYEIKPKERVGKSFPSRHAYSAFVIATLACCYSIPFGIALLFVATLLSLSRVLLGIHFPRDVIAGATFGVVSGILGILFLVLPNS